jgi:hypothetical protein
VQPLRIVINNRPATVEPVEETCPKCKTVLTGAVACVRCGLSRGRMARYARESMPPIVDALAVAWKRATLNWENVEHHDEVLRLVIANDAWAWAANKYRSAARKRPDDEITAAQLKRVEKGLLATTLALRTPRDTQGKTPYRGAVMFLAIGILALVIGGVWAKVRGEEPQTPDHIVINH